MELTAALLAWLAVGIAAHVPWWERTHSKEGTDKGMYNDWLFEGDILLTERRTAVSSEKQLWPLGAVIYSTHPSVGCPTSGQCRLLMEALEVYHNNTCLRFKEWSGEHNRIEVHMDPEDGACWSVVGRQAEPVQRVSLGYRCWYRGIVIHELGHSVGFWHEMTRPDRDHYIKIHWDNIIPNCIAQFAIHPNALTLGEPFDFKSVMLYDEYAFSKKDGYPTVEAKNPNIVIGPIWKKKGLSAGDIRRLSKLYHCKNTESNPLFPQDIICDFNHHTCGFKNGGFPAWRHKNGTDGYVFTSYNTAGSAVVKFSSINFHPLSLNDHVRKGLGCLRFWYQMHGNGPLYLKLFFIYLDKVTDLGYDEENVVELWNEDSPTATRTWVPVELNIYVTHPFKLIFESQFDADTTTGHIFLDELSVLYEPCIEKESRKVALAPTPDVNDTEAELFEEL